MADLAVVGAGIVGLAHAAVAHERGLKVVVVERATTIQGASVRNFGHLGFSAHGGVETKVFLLRLEGALL